MLKDLLQVQFLLSWYFSNREEHFEFGSRYFNTTQGKKGDAIVAFAASGPSSETPYIMETILVALSQARKSIRICTPYYIPSEQLASALMIAASNGITVELILPEKSDSFIVQHASFSFIKPLLQRGIKVYLYQKGFMHAKTISIDSKIGFVGTANMDTRSFFLNFEITALIHEPAFCNALESSFELDKQSSRLITIEKWKKRGLFYRGLDSVCRLVAPLL